MSERRPRVVRGRSQDTVDGLLGGDGSRQVESCDSCYGRLGDGVLLSYQFLYPTLRWDMEDGVWLMGEEVRKFGGRRNQKASAKPSTNIASQHTPRSNSGRPIGINHGIHLF